LSHAPFSVLSTVGVVVTLYQYLFNSLFPNWCSQILVNVVCVYDGGVVGWLVGYTHTHTTSDFCFHLPTE